jgi:hypothetical protein
VSTPAGVASPSATISWGAPRRWKASEIPYTPRSATASADSGVAAATVNAVQQIGGAIGTAVLNTVFASAVADYLAGRTRRVAEGDVLVVSHGVTLYAYLALIGYSGGISLRDCSVTTVEVSGTRAAVVEAGFVPPIQARHAMS